MGSILIVDDEVDVANGWARALKIEGHRVSVAYDAKTALESSRQHPFDLAILDYMMPSMTGIELLNEIRKDHPFIRSLIISGRIDTSVSEASVLSEIRTNIEADQYLHKPVDNARLKESVRSLLDNKGRSDWKSFANAKVGATAPKAKVRAAEKAMRRKKKKE